MTAPAGPVEPVVPDDRMDARERQAFEDAKLPRVLHDDHCSPYVPEHPCWCHARERWDWHLAHLDDEP